MLNGYFNHWMAQGQTKGKLFYSIGATLYLLSIWQTRDRGLSQQKQQWLSECPQLRFSQFQKMVQVPAVGKIAESQPHNMCHPEQQDVIKSQHTGWAFDIAVKTLLGTPVSYTGGPGIQSRPPLWLLFPANAHAGRQEVKIQVVKHPSPTW